MNGHRQRSPPARIGHYCLYVNDSSKTPLTLARGQSPLPYSRTADGAVVRHTPVSVPVTRQQSYRAFRLASNSARNAVALAYAVFRSIGCAPRSSLGLSLSKTPRL